MRGKISIPEGFREIFDENWVLAGRKLSSPEYPVAIRGWWRELRKFKVEEVTGAFSEYRMKKDTRFPKITDILAIIHRNRRLNAGSLFSNRRDTHQGFLEMPAIELQYYGQKIPPEYRAIAMAKLRRAGISGFKPWNESPMHKKIEEFITHSG